MKTNTQSKGIAFKNFRRFMEFPMLEFGNITYMVGRNNSGKSTMVKALLLILDYLQNQLSDTFSFDNRALEDANIVTFGRAKCNLIDEPEIVFSLKLYNYNIAIHISGDEDRTKANVNLLVISDYTKGYNLSINYVTGLTEIVKKAVSKNTSSISKNNQINSKEELDKITAEINELLQSRNDIKNKISSEALKITDQINKLEERKLKLFPNQKLGKFEEGIDYSLEYPIKYQMPIETKINKEFNNAMEVDLHISQLVSNFDKMTNHDIMTLQLSVAKRQLDFAIRKGISKIIFIYGTGEGVLKLELQNLLQSYSQVSQYDANPEKYGLSATEVYIDQNNVNNDSLPRTEGNELKEIISVFLYHNSIAYKRAIQKRDNDLNDEEVGDDSSSDIMELDNTQEELKDWIDQLVFNIEEECFIYLGANPSKQSALFQLRDKNNSLAQAIHEFKQLEIGESTVEDIFVKKWMREFEVGHDYKIDFYAGEAYQFHVLEDNGKVNHLSDKGMGSLQAMLLILRVACLIRINKKNKKAITLLVEEPELNLHPALQSKLTGFFHEVNKEFGFNFIVETHSEYMIRKGQLLVLEEDYLKNPDINPNPFKIFFFHKEEGPYEMEFTDEGKFKKDFGSGFYDEAGNMTLKMIKQIRKNNL